MVSATWDALPDKVQIRIPSANQIARTVRLHNAKRSTILSAGRVLYPSQFATAGKAFHILHGNTVKE